jgi:hypothetical protein
LKILREENRLDYMRLILRKGLTDLKAKNDTDLLKVSEQLERNFKEAFKQQKSEIGSLEKEVSRITRKEIPIVTGGFLAGFVPYVGNIVSLFTAGRDIKKLLAQRNKANIHASKLKGDFINLLLQSYED